MPTLYCSHLVPSRCHRLQQELMLTHQLKSVIDSRTHTLIHAKQPVSIGTSLVGRPHTESPLLGCLVNHDDCLHAQPTSQPSDTPPLIILLKSHIQLVINDSV